MPSAGPPCGAYQARVMRANHQPWPSHGAPPGSKSVLVVCGTRAIHGHHAEHHRAQRCAGGVWHVPSTGPPCSVWDRGLGCVYRIQVYTGEPQYSVYTGEYSRTPQMLVKIQAWLIGARVYGELPSFTEVASKPSWSTVT